MRRKIWGSSGKEKGRSPRVRSKWNSWRSFTRRIRCHLPAPTKGLPFRLVLRLGDSVYIKLSLIRFCDTDEDSDVFKEALIWRDFFLMKRIFNAILPLIHGDFWQFHLKIFQISSSQVCADLVPEQKEQKEPFEEPLDHSSQNGWKMKHHHHLFSGRKSGNVECILQPCGLVMFIIRVPPYEPDGKFDQLCVFLRKWWNFMG